VSATQRKSPPVRPTRSADDSSSSSGAENFEDEKGPPDEEILEEARARFKLCEDAEADQRGLELDDKKFLAGDQWPIDVKTSRAQEQRPCLTINRLPQFVQQITNEQRQNRPTIKVFPFGDGASEKTSQIRQGMIRNIEYISNADTAYDRAFYSTVSIGRGYWRIYPDYSDPESFDQDIRFGSIDNSHSVYVDPDSREPDGSDMKFGFITTDFTKDGFKAAYPNAELTGETDWQSFANRMPGWISERACRVAEYFYTDYRDVILLKLKETGRAVIKEDLKDGQFEQLKNDGHIVDERKSRVPCVRWCKINGAEILERTTLPGPYIPIFPVYGTESVIDGKRVWEGIVRHAKDPQRMYNYWASAETEAIALAPKAPWILAEGQVEGYEKQWETANRRNHPYLLYKPTTIAGLQAPIPQRNVQEPAVGAITQARAASAEDLKATTGMYDASFGNRSNEQSGVAVEKRVTQAQTTNFHFVDNLTRSIRHCGRVVNLWLSYYYDTARAVRILHPDGQDEVVMINQEFSHKGEKVTYAMDIGRYDVGVDAGPSYASRRQEAVQSLMDLFKNFPPAAQVAGDLLVKNMDWPGKDEIAERLKKLLPPGVDDNQNKNKAIPPEAQQHMQQMNQMIQKLTEEVNQQSEIIRTEKMQLESKERIAAIQAETQLRIAALKLDSQEAIVGFQEELQTLHRTVDQVLQSRIDDGSNPTGGEQPGQPATGGEPPGQPMGG
jgi:hypothetical protein